MKIVEQVHQWALTYIHTCLFFVLLRASSSDFGLLGEQSSQKSSDFLPLTLMSASEVTTIWRYTNVYIIIIIIMNRRAKCDAASFILGG